MTEKKAIPMSNDLLRSTNFDNDVIVGQDVTRQMALGVDYGALMGVGDEFQPLGITKNKKVLNIDVTDIGATYAGSDGQLTPAFPNYIAAAVLKNNTYATGLGFAFNTSVEQYFKSLRDSAGGFLFAEEMNEKGTLVGYPYRATNLIETVGGKTQIIFGNWNDLVIGEQGGLEIDTSTDGSWTDDAGNLISAFENDQTLIRAINNVDAGLRHEESFISVECIKEDGEVVNPHLYDYTQRGNMGIVYRDDGWLKLGYRKGLAYDIVEFKKAIEICYTAGYVLPKDATETEPQTLPSDLEGLVWEMVLQSYSGMQNESFGLTALKIGDVSWQFDRSNRNEWTQIIKTYRRY